MCAHTDAHTFCRYPPGPSPSCMGYIDSQLSSEEKARVLARLNRRRSEVARGIRGLPTAGDMLKLRWVDELAREAQRWADQCRPPNTHEEHDACRDLYSISVGQCVASVVGEAPGLRSETMADMWYMQSISYAGNISYIPNNYNDFAQMTWSRTYMVGCGRSKFMIQWYDRLRTVERLVCNFAPRGPAPKRALWTPAAPASICPPRSRPDVDLPSLCTFQHDMDETYDEDNVMTIEEHLLLNTIILIEKNVSLDNIGTLDEIYLTKLAVATIDNSVLTHIPFNSIQKRDLLEKIDIVSYNDQNENKIETDPSNAESSIANEVPHVMKKKLSNRKGNFVGRPKAYDIEELNNQNKHEINYNITQETTVRIDKNRNIYDYYQLSEIPDDTTSFTTIPMTTVMPIYDTTITDIEESNTQIIYIPKETSTNSTTTILDNYIDDIISNLNLTHILNVSSINENIIEDLLSDPETARQLQESLSHMENKYAVAGKVRRELRNQQNLSQNDEKIKKSGILSAEVERNKSIERGPMLNMVLKYMPYLKQYESSIMGDTSSRGTSFRFTSVFVFYCISILSFYFLEVL